MKGSDNLKLITCQKSLVSSAVAPVVGATDKKNGYAEGNGYLVSWCFGHLVGLKFPDDYCEKWAEKWSFSQLPMIPDTWKFGNVTGNVTKELKCQRFYDRKRC